MTAHRVDDMLLCPPTETAQEAATRAVLPLMAKIAGFGGHPLYPLEELRPDDLIRLAGEWVRLERIDGNALTVTKPDACCEWTYDATDGETFTRAEPF